MMILLKSQQNENLGSPDLRFQGSELKNTVSNVVSRSEFLS